MASLTRATRLGLRSARPLASMARAAPVVRPIAIRTITNSSNKQRPTVRPIGSVDLPPAPYKAPKQSAAHLPHPVWVHDKAAGGWLRNPSIAERTQFMQSQVEDGCLDFGLRFDFHVNTQVPLQALTSAWFDTLFRHPILGVEKHGDFTNGVWFYPDYDVPQNQMAWLKDTFAYLPTGGEEAVQTALDNQLSEPISHKYSLHLTLSPTGNGGYAAAMHCRHAAYDIQGVATVFCAFEQALAEALNGSLPKRQWGQEIKRLPIPTEQAVLDDVGAFTPQQIEEGSKEVARQMAEAAKPHFNLPYADPPNWAAVSSGVNKRTNVTLAPEETKAVIQAVKKANLSMTPFLIACAMHMLKSYAPPGEKQHVFLNVVNRRRWVAPERSSPCTHDHWPFFGNSVQVLHAPDRGDDVLRLARDVYERQWADLHPERPVPLWGLELAQKKYEDALVPFNPAQPPAYEPGAIYVSSPGPLDKGADAPVKLVTELGKVKITNKELGVNIRMTSAHSLLHIWTLGGKLQMQTTIPKWYDQQLAQKWMDDTKNLILSIAKDIQSQPAAKL